MLDRLICEIVIHARPVEATSKLSAASGPPVTDPTLFHSLAGALQYLTFTRPDISYAVQQLCLFMHDPRAPHPAQNVPLIMDLLFSHLRHSHSVPTRTLIGAGARTLGVRLPGIVYFWGILLSPGPPSAKLPLLVPVMKPNIMQLLMPLLRPYGCANFYSISTAPFGCYLGVL